MELGLLMEVGELEQLLGTALDVSLQLQVQLGKFKELPEVDTAEAMHGYERNALIIDHKSVWPPRGCIISKLHGFS